MPFRSSPADIESNASVFRSRTPPRPGCPPDDRPNTRITARAGDENRMVSKFLREARKINGQGFALC